MQDIAKRMMRDAIKDGFTLAVHYEDDYEPVYVGTDLTKAWDEATACDTATVDLRKEGLKDQWAFLVHGNHPSETINDYGIPRDGSGNWIDTWWSNNND
jgi:hypothetical protein